MGTAFATGHAAGIAAALVARGGKAEAREARAVRKELVRAGWVSALSGRESDRADRGIRDIR
ncbi:hypothetical protein [Nonomuraea sp. NPDC049028]|uniref:hypothetical protein n=1 Tax=Nonomuraea sp. NPDC049028 TaxID=3364348 RepID=UPI00371F6104